MGRTATLRRQHDAAVDLVGQIMAQSNGPATPDNAYRIGLLLAKLTGLLRIHFAQEDHSLYPALLASPASGLTARHFMDEMGDLAITFDAFTKRWGSSAAIAANFDGFRRESAAVFTALADRVKRENEKLYPLAEANEQALRRTA